jgi:hypothetical protein
MNHHHMNRDHQALAPLLAKVSELYKKLDEAVLKSEGCRGGECKLLF